MITLKKILLVIAFISTFWSSLYALEDNSNKAQLKKLVFEELEIPQSTKSILIDLILDSPDFKGLDYLTTFSSSDKEDKKYRKNTNTRFIDVNIVFKNGNTYSANMTYNKKTKYIVLRTIDSMSGTSSDIIDIIDTDYRNNTKYKIISETKNSKIIAAKDATKRIMVSLFNNYGIITYYNLYSEQLK